MEGDVSPDPAAFDLEERKTPLKDLRAFFPTAVTLGLSDLLLMDSESSLRLTSETEIAVVGNATGTTGGRGSASAGLISAGKTVGSESRKRPRP